MSIIKSFSVGNGDMFYINHNSSNFTMIDCCLTDENREPALAEMKQIQDQKEITRFISTHPDDDHLRGLEWLDARLSLVNFYCVKNAATKEIQTDSFKHYCELRDSAKAYHISKGCSRKWMNTASSERGAAGINILWPDPANAEYKAALAYAAIGGSPNNISAVIQYSLQDGVTALWMGDLETAFMESIEDYIDLPRVDILFAPHHGRDSGRVPKSYLDIMQPKIVVVGEADCGHLHYYPNYNTICQNSAGDIVFDCQTGKVDIYTSKDYELDYLTQLKKIRLGYYYVGTLVL